MSWQEPSLTRAGGPAPPPPDDGIAASAHPPGPLGARWNGLLDRVPREARDRVLRGKNFARRGRLRALSVGPGGAAAEVVAEVVCHPSLRVRPLEKGEWAVVTSALRADLGLVTGLLEGDVSTGFLDAVATGGVHLMPRPDELGWDCDCGDYVMPCSHAATVFHVLTDALDGDPFLLLSLRGRTREQLLGELLTTWGDPPPPGAVAVVEDEAVGDGEWLHARAPIPELSCSIGGRVATGAGIRALGPPPGAPDLLAALLPLYDAGGAASLLAVEASGGSPHPARRGVRREVEAPFFEVQRAQAEAAARHAEAARQAEVQRLAEAARLAEVAREADAARQAELARQAAVARPVSRPSERPVDGPVNRPPSVSPDGGVIELTEALVDLLADVGELASADLAQRLGATRSAVRLELVALERTGVVGRREVAGELRWRVL